MSIITVTGPIPVSEAGCTLSHEHVLCDLWTLTQSYDGILDDEALAAKQTVLEQMCRVAGIIPPVPGLYRVPFNPVRLYPYLFSEGGSLRRLDNPGDGVKKYDIAEIESERRNGYAWYGTWGKTVAERYTRWNAERSQSTTNP